MAGTESDARDGAYEARVGFLVESSRTAHEELIFRIKHRDDWLKTHLVVQVALLGIASGVEVVGIKSASSVPDVLALAVPASFVLAALYFTEDRLAGLLSRHRAGLSNLERRLARASTPIPSFEASRELDEFRRWTLPVRCLAQFVAFVVVPGGLAAYRFASVRQWSTAVFAEVVFDALLLTASLALLVASWALRQWPKEATP